MPSGGEAPKRNDPRDRQLPKSETTASSKPGLAPPPVPRRTKTGTSKLSRSMSTDGVPRDSNDDKEKEKSKKAPSSRSKSVGISSKREKSSRGERSITRSGSLRKIENNYENITKSREKDLPANISPLRSVRDSVGSPSAGRNEKVGEDGKHQMKDQPSSKADKSMDEMINLAWIKPIKEKEKEKKEKEKEKGDKSKKDDKRDSKGSKSKKDDNKNENKSSKKKLDDKLGGKKSRKKDIGEDASVASSVVKPRTAKVSTAECDKGDQSDKKSVTKVPNRKMSWFGFPASHTKDDSSCEGSFSGFDDSFSSIEREEDSLEDSISVMDLMNAKDTGDEGDDGGSGSPSSNDESSDNDSPDTSSSSSADKDGRNDDEKRADKDARERRKRAAELRKLQKKKKLEEDKKKRQSRPTSNGIRGPDHGRRGENPARRSGASGHQSEQFDGSMRNRPRGGGRGGMHQSMVLGRNDNSRPRQDPIEGDQSFREGGGSRRNRCIERSRSFDDSTSRYDDREGARLQRPRGVQRTVSYVESPAFGSSRLGQRTTGGGPYDDGGSRRGRRTVGDGDLRSFDIDNSRQGRRTGDMEGSRRGRTASGDPYDDTLNGSRHGRDMEGSLRGRRTAGGHRFDELNGSRHGRRTGGGSAIDFNGSSSARRHGGHTIPTGGGDPFDDWNNNDDPFSVDPFDDLNSSQASFNGNSSSRGARHRAARARNVQNKALATTLNSSQDQLAFVHAGKWMTEKEREANAPPKVQAWEKRRQKR